MCFGNSLHYQIQRKQHDSSPTTTHDLVLPIIYDARSNSHAVLGQRRNDKLFLHFKKLETTLKFKLNKEN